MSDQDLVPPPETARARGRYPMTVDPATPSLATDLRREIRSRGAIRFPDFMAAALYSPDRGYYARHARQVGRSGDFFTSVSVGPLFGQLLARRFLKEWQALGAPSRWRIVEIGAHDGTLAADILGEISRLDPAAFTALEYAIPEPLPVLAAAQRATLAAFSVHFLTDIADLAADPLPGVIFGNEILDALPFHIIQRENGAWREIRVAIGPDDAFQWEMHEIQDPALVVAVEKLGDYFRDGYRTEVRTDFPDFLTPLTRALTAGLLLWPDYGFARPEFYDPARSAGTLRTFSNHRAGDDPLATPGEIDITAHVDFTAFAEAAIALGCVPTAFRSQGSWLTRICRDWLLAQEGQPDPTALRQFQTLTHPAHLGGHFHMLELAWNQPGTSISTEVAHRLALQACPPPSFP